MAKEVLVEAMETGVSASDIVSKKGLSQISDAGKLEEMAALVLARNEKSVNDYKSGKKNALAFLVGQVMKETGGAANPVMVNEILKKRMGNDH
jgi:aspartyl-tRNA(Asn)/glutamyl-tRNA(Gln) amidotransferase subunit B